MASGNLKDLIIQVANEAALPTPEIEGRLAYAIAEKTRWRDNGSAWIEEPPDTDVVGSLGYTPENQANKENTTLDTSTTKYPTNRLAKEYVDNSIAAAIVGLLDFKGSTDCSANPNYPTALKGDTYVVSVAGKIGGASGKSVEVGDFFIATADNAGGTEASVGTSWTVIEHNLIGALIAANNLSDLASASTARTNLGLGTIAVRDAGYGANQVPYLSATPGTPDGTKVLRDDGVWTAQVTGDTDVEDLQTVETDTDMRLAPDGVGGVEWVSGSGGGGSSGTYEKIYMGASIR